MYKGMTVGVFATTADAAMAIARLRDLGFKNEHLTVLAPGSTLAEISKVPTTDTEQGGMAAALGGSILGALSLGVAVTIFLPAGAPITVIGALAAGLLGIGGTAAGAALGASLERPSLSGVLPVDELYVYEDALEKGHTVVFVSTKDRAEEAQRELAKMGAETIDAAKENWWVGLRDAEKLEYSDSTDPTRDEALFRVGFEAALKLGARGKKEEEIEDLVQQEYPDLCRKPHFVRGYKRGMHNLRRGREMTDAPTLGGGRKAHF